MRFEKASEKDIDIVDNIVSESIKTTYSEYYPQEVVEFFLKIHRRENILKDLMLDSSWILYDGDKAVGTGCVKDDHISRVYILPECQGKGYGRAIMDLLESQVSPEYSSVYLDPSLPGVGFYQKRGYATIKHSQCTLDSGVVFDHDVMEKKLR